MADVFQHLWPGPHSPDPSTQSIPGSAFDEQVRTLGWRFGWLRAHTCPCAYSNGLPGSPNPNCLTCLGRGVYWDTPPIDTLALLTFMHTSASPDEPGSITTEFGGKSIYGEPVITIPNQGDYNENQVWNYASTFDAFVEYDAHVRFNTTLVVSDSPSAQVLPYQFGVEILSVSSYDLGNNAVAPIPAGAWSLDNGVVTLSSAYGQGTAYTVEYLASPVYVAYRHAGGLPHTRPLAQGKASTPKRFHIALLDQWLRARGGGEGPAFGRGPKGGRA